MPLFLVGSQRDQNILKRAKHANEYFTHKLHDHTEAEINIGLYNFQKKEGGGENYLFLF